MNQHSSHLLSNIPELKTKTVLAPLAKFKTHLKKCIELNNVSKNLIELLHGRPSSRIFSAFDLKRKRPNSICYLIIELTEIKSTGELIELPEKTQKLFSNSWLKQTKNKVLKIRKKNEITENFFGNIVNEEQYSIDERIAWLRNIYLSKHWSIRCPSIENFKYHSILLS